MLTCIDSENERVLAGVRPIGHVSQCLGCQAVNQGAKQLFNVARQLALNRTVLNKRILQGVVQLQNVVHGLGVDGIEVGELPVQQLMQGVACVTLEVRAGQHCIVCNVGDVHTALAVNGGCGYVTAEDHVDVGQAEVFSNLMNCRSEGGAKLPSEILWFDHLDSPTTAKL